MMTEQFDWSAVKVDEPKKDGDFDWSAVSVTPPAAEPKPEGFTGRFSAGFKRSLPETKSLLVGAGAAVAGAVGADDTANTLIDKYREIDQNEVKPLASDTAFTDVVAGDGKLSEWAGDTLGNFAGQALQSVAAAGAGAVVGSALPGAGTVGGAIGGVVAKEGVKKLVGKQVAEMVAEKAATTAGKKKLAGMAAGATLATGMNVGQEIGIGYTGRAEDAAAAGEAMTKADGLRAIGWGVPAGLLDTVAEVFAAKGLFKGASASPSFIKRMLAGMAKGAAVEGGTEGAQAFLERMGADQDVATKEAFLDYVNNAAAGALGGGVAGTASGFKRQQQEQPDQGGLDGLDSNNAQPPPPAGTSNIDPTAGPISAVAAAADGNALNPVSPALDPFSPENLGELPASPLGNIADPLVAQTAERDAGMDLLVAQHEEEQSRLYQVADSLGLDATEIVNLDDSELGTLKDLNDYQLAAYAAHLAQIPVENIAKLIAPFLPETAPAETAVPEPVASTDPGQETPSGQTTDGQAFEYAGRRVGVTNPRAEDGNEIVMLDAERADASFRTSTEYVGKGGEGGVSDRYQGVGKFLETAETMDAPDAYMDDAGLRFTDGRHRFANLRDNGVKEIPVSMTPEAAQLARESGLTTDSAPVAPVADAPAVTDPQAAIDAAAHTAATSDQNDLPQPTDAQKEAGNYKKGMVKVNGHDISIENPAGSQRDPKWPALANHYGYIKGTKGADKDHVDLFLTDKAADVSLPVFVVDQVNADGSFDEHKIIMGAATEDEARAAYKSNYSKDWKGDGAITQMSQDEFKAWVYDAEKTARPAAKSKQFANYKKWLDDGKDFPIGMRQQMMMDTTMYDGEYEELIALADGKAQPTEDSITSSGKIEYKPEYVTESEKAHEKINAKRQIKSITTWRGKNNRGDNLITESIVFAEGGSMVVTRYEDTGKFHSSSGDTNPNESSTKSTDSDHLDYGAYIATRHGMIDPELVESAKGYVQAEAATAPKKPDAKPEKPKPLSKSEASTMMADLHRDFINDPGMVGKTVDELVALLLEKADIRLPQVKVDQLARNLHRDLKKNAEELAKQKNRNPAVRSSAIADALGGQDDADKVVSFTAGFDHALSGKTKSTLAGEHIEERIRGYEAARKWVKGGEGKAWFEGVPYKKLENTGADLRRWYEQELAKKKANEPMENTIWKAMQDMAGRFLVTSRGDDGATPGTGRAIDLAKKKMPSLFEFLAEYTRYDSFPFRENDMNDFFYLSTSRGRWSGTVEERAQSYIKKLLSEASLLNWAVPESEYVEYETRRGDKGRAPPLNANPSVEDRQAALFGVVQQYIDALTKYNDDLASAKSAADVPEITKAQVANIPKDKKTTRQFNEIIFNEAISELSQTDRSYSTISEIIRSETSAIDNNRAKPMVAPRLDKITRTGLGDVRNGEDMTPARFKEDLGFADVGFGTWVKGEGGQDHLNYAYDAFMDLAKHFGIPPKMIGLGGKMHFAIGALGRGKAAAHFSLNQPHPDGGTVPVINVTNTQGDGTVYHEWTHAFDLHGAQGQWPQVRAKLLKILKTPVQTRESVRRSVVSLLTGSSYYKGMKKSGRVEMAKLKARQIIADRHTGTTSYKTEADALGADYWGNNEELIARSLEAWAFDTLGGTSDYLVSPSRGEGVWSKANGYRGSPYPTGEERKLFAQVYDALRKSVSVVDGKLSVSLDAFNKALPESIDDGISYARSLLEGDAMEKLRDEVEAEAEARAAARNEQAQAEAAKKKAEEDAVVAAALADLEAATVPDPAQAMGAVTDDEFSKLFDQIAAKVNESLQEKPEAEAPGQTIRDMGDDSRATAASSPASTTLEDKQARTAKRIAAEAAKSGVEGLGESMQGLVKLFGGGSGRLQSFPGGVDESTYKAAKPHFEAALKKFQEAGKGLADLIEFIYRQFGDGIKPYLARFVSENKLGMSLANQDEKDASMKVAKFVSARIESGLDLGWRELFAEADKAFGGTQAEGKYTPKDAYDALEAGVNTYIMANKERFRTDVDATQAVLNVARLSELTNRLPTQTKRTPEMDEFQQFSTVPPFAYMANWVAAPTSADVVLEPSAGIGGLAVFSHNAGAKLVLNELSDRRASVLQSVFPGADVHRENAEQIDRILDEDIIPTLVVMNPPFSSTAGRLQGERDSKNGAKHLDQALSRLADGGRLVAIVGKGMAKDAPAFADWWAKTEAKYDVRAAIEADGSGYAKYGTTFDNVLIVIDKVKPSGRPVVTTKVSDYNQLAGILQEIRNDRPTAELSVSTDEVAQRDGIEPPYSQDRQEGEPDPAGTAADSGIPAVVGTGAGLGDRGPGKSNARPGTSRPGTGLRPADTGNRTGSDASNNPGSNGRPDGGKSGLSVETTELAQSGELTDAIFDEYLPQRLSIPGSKPHPGRLVESSAMASVFPPKPDYTPNLPAETVEQGLLSLAQLESVVYAGLAHSQFLPNGERRGFFVGDGTGVGKGREIGGILLDNMRQGRTKAVWISEKQGLFKDAKRDLKGVGGDPEAIKNMADVTTAEWKMNVDDGVIFTTYATLRSKQQWQVFERDDAVVLKDGSVGKLGKINKKDSTINFVGSKGKRVVPWADIQSIAGNDDVMGRIGRSAPASFEPRTRLQQLVEWLGPEFDGVIAFDEAHNAGNAIGETSGRGGQGASAQAEAVVQLQKLLPKARVVYVSATGATKVENLAYTTRLGLWGEGTAFSNVEGFVNQIKAGGLAIMELVARDLKQMGAYVARSLSYEDVTYSRLEHSLSPVQRDIYDRLADAFQVILKDLDSALELTNIKEGGKTRNKHAANGIKSLFWGTQQRFFSQIITAMQLPTVFDQIDRDLAAGEAVVIQLVNTNEAAQERAVSKAATSGEDITEEFDMSPKDSLIDMVMRAFPIYQYEITYDENNKRISTLVVDSSGNPVVNREALAMRDSLVKDLGELRYPESPLEQLVNYYGPDAVAEVTGRKRRFVSGQWNPDGTGKIFEQKRGKAAAANDADAFMEDKRKLLIFSDAGGTGFSFHADKSKVNQRKRKHYLLQPGWRADKAVQGFGRTHRTNQDSAPHYFLVATDIPAHKRFLSSIARRLDQLGALTRGQRDTANQGMFSEKDNLESKYAVDAMTLFFKDLKSGQIKGLTMKGVLSNMGLENIIDEETGDIAEKKMPPVTQVLNRMLSMNLDTQEKVFSAFIARMEMLIDEAIAKDDYDTGLQTIKALKVDVVQEEVVYTDPRTSAETRYVQLSLEQPNTFYEFTHQRDTAMPLTYVKNNKSERVYIIAKMGQRTNRFGGVLDTYQVRGTGGMYRKSHEELYDYQDKLIGLTEITETQAMNLWVAENAARPATVSQEAHLITGAVLPVWDRMATESRIQVVRTQAADGRRFLGRLIPKAEVKDVRKRFNVTAAVASMSPVDLMKAILGGMTGELSNGWKLKRSIVSGEARIEIYDGRRDFSTAASMELSSYGIFSERISWQDRYFVPVGTNGLPVLERLLASKPLADVIDPNENKAADAGSALLSRPASPVKGRVSVAQAREELGQSANTANLTVLQSPEDLPDRLKTEGYKTADGLYDGKNVYIIADNLRNAGQARIVLAHELIGHYGIEAVTGPELWKQLDATIAKMQQNPTFNRLFEEIERRYPGADRTTFVKESIAVMAEKGVRNSVMDRVAHAIRQFLRKLGFTMPLSDAEIRSLVPLVIREQLSKSARFVQQGARAETATAAPAFSSTTPSKSWAYSPLARMVKDSTLTAAPADQWKKWIAANAGKMGVKADEIEFSGINEWLDLLQGKVSKEDIGAYLDADGVRVVEVLKEEDGDTDSLPDGWRVVDQSVEQGIEDADLQFVVVDEDGEIKGEGDTRAEAVSDAQDPDYVSAEMPFRNLRPAGGGEYKEILMTLPKLPYHPAHTVMDGNLKRYKDRNFRSSHWLEPNVVVHVRFDIRKDSDGNDVVFIIEIQSDWGQQGRKDGFMPKGETRGAGVIRGPFVTDTKAWVALAIKRMIRYAADNGIDRITLANGEQSINSSTDDNPTGDQKHGANVFYNQLVPQVANEVLRKLGGGKVTRIDLGEREQNGFIISPDLRDKALAGDVPLFSQPAGVMTKPATISKWLSNKLTDIKPQTLGLIPMNYLTDFAHKKVSAIQNYIDARYAMEQMRNTLHQKYDAVSQDWLALAAGDKRVAQELAELMHEATIASVDPEAGEATYMTEKPKHELWKELNARYMAMPAEARKVYVAARNAYTSQVLLLEDVLVENFDKAVGIQINRSERTLRKRIKEVNEDGGITEARREELLLEAEQAHAKRVKDAGRNSRSRAANLRLRFEGMRVAAPYFPLARFGRYSIAVKKDGRIISFSKRETIAEAEALGREFESQGNEVTIWVDDDKNNLRDPADPVLIADIDEIISGSMMDVDKTDGKELTAAKEAHNTMISQMRDAIYQRYLDSLPDLSMRKSFIHRKKTAGFSDDALRAFSSTMFHGSYQVARLRYGMEMGEYLDIASEQAKEHDPVQGNILINEMRKRHEWVMNPKGSAAAQVATTGAFVFYLGANPAHLFLNATQTAMIGIPVLGSKYGFGSTAKHLFDATKLFFNTGGDISKALTGDELKAFREFEKSGLLDKSQVHDLAGVGENGVEYSAVREKWMRRISWFFHQSEVFNREVTALAAYRLAREAKNADGTSKYGHSPAIRAARKQTYEIHFDYSNANRPRFMQSDAMKILLVFRNYNINLLYRLFRDIHDSMKGETPASKAEARKQLGAMMGMYSLMAGVTGMPFYGLAVAIAGAFDDEDEPFGAEEQFKQGMAEFLGPEAARYVLGGVPGTALNIDLRERIGMPNLWFRSPDRELEGRDYYYYWMEQLLGANAGMAKSIIMGSSQVANGLKEMNGGDIQRGVETMLPAAVKSVAKAGRYAVEGQETNLDGDKIIETGPGAILARALGFTPQDLAIQYDRNNTLKAADAKLIKRRTTLINRYGLAATAGDAEGARDAIKSIIEFNRNNPGYSITRGGLDRSLRLKARNDALNANGIVLNRRMQGLQSEMEGEQ